MYLRAWGWDRDFFIIEYYFELLRNYLEHVKHIDSNKVSQIYSYYFDSKSNRSVKILTTMELKLITNR